MRYDEDPGQLLCTIRTEPEKKEKQGTITLEGGDDLHRLLLLPVVVHVQLQHNLNSAAATQQNKISKTDHLQSKSEEKRNPNSIDCK